MADIDELSEYGENKKYTYIANELFDMTEHSSNILARL